MFDLVIYSSKPFCPDSVSITEITRMTDLLFDPILSVIFVFDGIFKQIVVENHIKHIKEIELCEIQE